jgi:asparagine synthase (glutamine-hydrolysing)
MFDFDDFSPYTLPKVIEVAEAIPFIALTGWNHEKLYRLKGEVVSKGVKAVTGIDMPIFVKRRFQHGAATRSVFDKLFAVNPSDYRRTFNALYE